MNQTEIDHRDGIQLELDAGPSLPKVEPQSPKMEPLASKVPPRPMTDEEFQTIGNLIEACPEAKETAWDIFPKTLVVRFKKPDDHLSRGLSWATALADIVVQSGSIISKLWGEVLIQRARVAELENHLYPLRQAHPLTEAEEYDQAVIRG